MLRGRIDAGGRVVLKRPGRYDNVKPVFVDGTKFDSPREGDRYTELKLMLRAGVIADLELQPRIYITIGGVDVRFNNGRHVAYVADFRYQDLEKGITIVEDVKMQSGHRPRDYVLKRAMIAAMGIEILEY